MNSDAGKLVNIVPWVFGLSAPTSGKNAADRRIPRSVESAIAQYTLDVVLYPILSSNVTALPESAIVVHP